ncbi:hypothetical protein HFP15_05425 [Amycolatopsis sp. K13G38]|uniref:Uncharacterized protein n=1 Tax=Amycolatopsis acididurans TaxID=2724524 RepID=A0ABX1IYT3_9PSEU|nr:hypothetical protein [Amycolatopsis acididurans]NKQ52316.1 hypothetical protein [Amycolatopsis acididurans]
MVELAGIANAVARIRLSDLLRITNLTAAQARILAWQVAGAAATDGSRTVDLDSVWVDRYGDVVISGREDRAALAAVLGALATEAERDERDDGSVRAAADAAAAGADRGTILSIVDKDPEPERVLKEIAALVEASGGRRLQPAGRRGRPTRRLRAPAPRPAARAVLRPLWRGLAALIVLGAAVLLEVLLLHDRLAGDLKLVFGDRNPPASTSAPTAPTGLPAVPPAPAAAGQVSRVELRALQPCTTGAPCPVRVLVQLSASPRPVTVSWEFQLEDRCTGARVTAPGSTVTAGAGDTDLSVVDQVQVPAAKSVAMFGVTGEPARASASALQVGGPTC